MISNCKKLFQSPCFIQTYYSAVRGKNRRIKNSRLILANLLWSYLCVNGSTLNINILTAKRDTNMSNFHPIEVVGHGNETFQVGEI